MLQVLIKSLSSSRIPKQSRREIFLPQNILIGMLPNSYMHDSNSIVSGFCIGVEC
jgi:hypothetical protein